MRYDVNAVIYMEHHATDTELDHIILSTKCRFEFIKTEDQAKFFNFNVIYDANYDSAKLIELSMGDFNGKIWMEHGISELEDVLRYLAGVENYEIWPERSKQK